VEPKGDDPTDTETAHDDENGNGVDVGEENDEDGENDQ
jgi:hypothetical protein